MEKKTYETLDLEVIRFEAADVITASGSRPDDCTLTAVGTVYNGR